MPLIDTHTHLYDERFAPHYAAAVADCLAAGVEKLYMPNCDSTTIAPMLHLADSWPDACIPMMGLHPTYVKETVAEELAIIESWLGKRPFAAIGEIGLDYYWDKTFVSQQKKAFATQMEWAAAYHLPIVIHSREATQDCIDMVREKQQRISVKGIFHCFSGTVSEAEQIAAMGMYIGIGGVVTYKNGGLAETVSALPLNIMVLETDAPYLAPVPYRGKPNHSRYLPLIAQRIADLKGLNVTEVTAITTANAKKVFGQLPA